MPDPRVDDYLQASTQWPDEIRALRPMLLGAGLDESLKWKKPCYTHGGANVVILQEMKAFLALMFFNGAVLDDPEGILEEQGPNSRSARRVTFTSVDDVTRLAPAVAQLIADAIAADEQGRALPPAPAPVLAPELQERLDADPALAAAFAALTPGRQREFHLHIAAAKQEATRRRRVDACAPRILVGKGLRDR